MCASQRVERLGARGQVKMRELGVTTHPDYKVTLLMDHKSMVTVSTDKYGAHRLPFVFGIRGRVRNDVINDE